MEIVYDDGGRSKYFRGRCGDCVVRAIAIVSGMDYKMVYDMVRKAIGVSPRDGVHTRLPRFKELMKSLGFEWHATMQFGQGCKVHLADGEVPKKGRLICTCSKHWTAVIDGVIHDTYDPSRLETRCVYGYWLYKK
jgi:hypothetical protein